MDTMNEAPPLAHVMDYHRWQDFGVCTKLYAAAKDRISFIALDRIFFGKSGRPRLIAAAVEWCIGCPAKQLCFEYSVVHDERFGVWGGLSVKQRDRYLAMHPGLRRTLLKQAVEENWVVDSLLDESDQRWVQAYRESLMPQEEVVPQLSFLDDQTLPESFLHTAPSFSESLVG